MTIILLKLLIILVVFTDLIGHVISKFKDHRLRLNTKNWLVGYSVGIVLGIVLRLMAMYYIWN